MRTIGMLDLRSEYELLREEVRAVIDDVLQSQWFVGGPAVGEFEEAVRTRYGAASAVAVSSGTDALLCALMALEIGPDDEVILPAFTFFATAGAISRLGAKPVFVDIDPRTFNLDPDKVESAVTSRTRAIIAVHVFGQCADMDAISDIADRHGLSVVEDAAQAIEATYNGKFAGTLGRVGCFSFYPTKNLGGFGEGGLILTRDEALGDIARQLRNHGESRRYHHERVGGNFRLDTMKAAILLVKLGYLDEFTDLRRSNAQCYDELLVGAPVTTPYAGDACKVVYHQYSILCDRRDQLVEFLGDRGVGTGVYYPGGLHLQECFASLGYKPGSLPETERTCQRVVSLPCHPMLAEDDVRYVAACIHEFYGTAASGPADVADTNDGVERTVGAGSVTGTPDA